ncbi:MAG: hypothetical protein V4697_01620 [Patescibacteria group bacterium]
MARKKKVKQTQRKTSVLFHLSECNETAASLAEKFHEAGCEVYASPKTRNLLLQSKKVPLKTVGKTPEHYLAQVSADVVVVALPTKGGLDLEAKAFIRSACNRNCIVLVSEEDFSWVGNTFEQGESLTEDEVTHLVTLAWMKLAQYYPDEGYWVNALSNLRKLGPRFKT